MCYSVQTWCAEWPYCIESLTGNLLWASAMPIIKIQSVLSSSNACINIYFSCWIIKSFWKIVFAFSKDINNLFKLLCCLDISAESLILRKVLMVSLQRLTQDEWLLEHSISPFYFEQWIDTFSLLLLVIKK